ncbi:MAG TPA: hypothetical protein VMB52_05325 [Verrucomicrobiae bacterium]|nr:hypothetical protein [Verrucomicrobiae bacterium]
MTKKGLSGGTVHAMPMDLRKAIHPQAECGRVLRHLRVTSGFVGPLPLSRRRQEKITSCAP